jgi:hypothetical protein
VRVLLTSLAVACCGCAGNDEWFIQKGSFFGETQISSVSVS